MRTNHTTNGERAQVYLKDGREIGGIIEDTFVKHVEASKHFLRTPPAIAFDLSTLADAKANGAKFVRVVDRESGASYTATVATIWKRGFPVSRGFGEQIALALNEWNRGDDDLNVEQLGLAL